MNNQYIENIQMFLCIQNSIPGLEPYKLAESTIAEDHLHLARKSNKSKTSHDGDGDADALEMKEIKSI